MIERMKKRMTMKEKIDEAKVQGIDICNSDILLKDGNVVGIYKFFRCKKDGENGENDEFCFYIGKSTDVAGRLLGSGGHIYMYLMNKDFDFSELVPQKIKEYLGEGYKIKVVIKEVNYSDTSFSKAAHRLAYEELKEIVKYQEEGECLFQTPEGVGDYQKIFWENNYKKEDQQSN